MIRSWYYIFQSLGSNSSLFNPGILAPSALLSFFQFVSDIQTGLISMQFIPDVQTIQSCLRNSGHFLISAPQGRIFNIAVGCRAMDYTLKKSVSVAGVVVVLFYSKLQSFYQSYRLLCIRKLLRIFVKMW